MGNDLNDQGWKRAKALPDFFKTNAVVNQFGPLVAIYSMAPSRADGSVRAIHTMEATAQSLSLTIHQALTKNEIGALVSEINTTHAFDSKTVVICWEHKMIPVIANTFGLRDGPDSWDRDASGNSSFDRAWILTFRKDGMIAFQDIAEHVLPGDSD